MNEWDIFLSCVGITGIVIGIYLLGYQRAEVKYENKISEMEFERLKKMIMERLSDE